MAGRNTVDQLLSDLADGGYVVNPERVRHRVRSFVRNVFRDIGWKLTCGVYTQEFNVLGHNLELADHVMFVLDVGETAEDWNGKQISMGMMSGDYLAYWEEPFNLHFPNLQTGKVMLRFYGLLVDGEGQAIIPEQAYEACLKRCQAELVVDLPNHHRFNQQMVMAQQAELEIAKARGDLNKTSLAKLRTQRQGGSRPSSSWVGWTEPDMV